MHLINLTGYYIIPGLFDMHAHVANIEVSSYNYTESIEMLHKLLGWGITTIRNPGGPTEQAVMLRDMVNAGQLIGPQIFTAGNLINSFPQTGFVETIVQMRQMLERKFSINRRWVWITLSCMLILHKACSGWN